MLLLWVCNTLCALPVVDDTMIMAAIAQDTVTERHQTVDDHREATTLQQTVMCNTQVHVARPQAVTESE